MIQPLQIGQRIFDHNLIQGPLAGVSAAPFRLLTAQHGRPAYACTEMLSCKTLLNKSLSRQERFVKIDPEEAPVCFQLAANNPAELGEAVKRVTDLGADLIDLNCGCPVKKIRSKGAGSRLLTEPAALYQLITSMKNNTHLPVTVKIRVEGGSDDSFNESIATVIEEAGADALIVHGRHWTEHYETPVNHHEIAYFVKRMKIPVIGNGDVNSLASLKQMFATGCQGVMIGRAGMGQPWLIQQLITEWQGQTFQLPEPRQIASYYLQHTQQLIELLGNEKFAILQTRRFAKYYAKYIADKAAFCLAMNECSDFETFTQLCARYFN